MAVIYANQSWQDSGININSSANVIVNYVGGLWTSNPNVDHGTVVFMYDANGNPGYIAHQAGYTLLGAHEGCLCGKVANSANENTPVFFVGNNAVIPNTTTGRLYLVINDDLEGIYGAGLADNLGQIIVMASSAEASIREILAEAAKEIKTHTKKAASGR
jgi:hypothetical protein